MSQPHSRSPFYSRSSTLPGRQEDGSYGEHYHSSVRSDQWRNLEKVNKLEGNSHWDNGPSQGVEEVDHWAKFIEAIGHAGRPRPSPMSRYHTQEDTPRFEDKSSHSPRRLPRERLSSPEALRHSAERRQRIPSPNRSRNEHDGVNLDRHYSNRTHWDSRGSSPRHSQWKRHDRMEHGYHNEEHDRYHERSSFSERSLKSNYREHHPHPKRFRGSDPQEDYSISHRGFSSHNAPVIVEHDHGISNSDANSRGPPRNHDPLRNPEHLRSRDSLRVGNLPRNRDPLRGNDLPKDRDHLRARDPHRTSEPSRGREPLKQRRDPERQPGNLQGERLGGSANYLFGEESRFHHSSVERGSPIRGRSQHQEQSKMEQHVRERHMQHREHSRMEPHARERHEQHREHSRMEPHSRERHEQHREHSRMGPHAREQHEQHREHSRMGPHAREHHEQKSMDLTSDVDLRNNKSNKARASGHAWEETKPKGNHGGVLEPRKVLKGIPHHRNPNTNASPATRMNFTEHETLRIKVDMSRPVGQSSHLGYSSERQLSLDLVNVGRQRLDFLPMLEHSGTYRESAMHSGTFAQEIITLVHHVKENYFEGQDMTLNERFSSEQHYSFADEDECAEEELELEEMNPVINRPLGGLSSETQIFCKLESWEPQRRLVPAPGDLRHDLERRRQQRLEGVKITIAGGSFSQLTPQSPGNEPAYRDEEDECEANDFDWSEQVSHQTKQWDGPCQKTLASNFNARQNAAPNFNCFAKRRGSHIKKNPNNDANW